MKVIQLILCVILGALWSPKIDASNSSKNSGTDNPMKSHYGDKYPTWTDEIRWDNQINMATYSNGANDFARFENARNELHSQGGGVLYYPAGIYDFSDIPKNNPDGRGLMLKSGVVILGEEPTSDDVAIDGNISLTTVFNFPFESKAGLTGNGEVPYAWNLIGITPGNNETLKDVNNVGIAWVQIDGASVYFGMEANWGPTLGTSGAWYSNRANTGIWKDRVPDGTHPLDVFSGYSGSSNRYLGAGRNRFVFGCELKNSTVHNPKVIDLSLGGNFGYYIYKFGSRIAIYGSNVFVANNLLSKSDKNFLYEQTTAITEQDRCNQVFGTHPSILLYDYGKTFGIDINKTFLNVFPNKSEGYFLENIIVRDNYIYNHGGKGVDVSGKWVSILNNHNERDYLQEGDNVYSLLGSEEYELTLDGWFESVPGGNGCLSDNQSRAFDLAGQALWIDGNSWNNLGSNPGNDGESILCQRHGGTEIHSWALTRNTYRESYNESNKGYLSGYDVHNQGMLVAWNDTESTVGNLKAGNLYDCAYIPNEGEEFLRDYIPAVNDILITCPEGSLEQPTVEIIWPEDSSYVEVRWNDNTDNEIGYRVDRRVKESESWSTIAYRPRQSLGHENNEPGWRDYTASPVIEYEYRAVAINCDDDVSGASDWINALALETIRMPTIEQIHGSIYTDSVEVIISSFNLNSDIYYTTDGSEPTSRSTHYTAPFYVEDEMTIKAIVLKGDLEPSGVSEYQVHQLGSPSISTCEGGISETFDPLSVTITAGEQAKEIRYSFSNLTISKSDFEYRQPLQIVGEVTLYARAFGENILPSDVASCSFEFLILQIEDENKRIIVYPNPVRDQLNVEGSNIQFSILSFSMYNLSGKLVHKELIEIENNVQQLDLSRFPSGNYILKITSEENLILSRKIMIK